MPDTAVNRRKGTTAQHAVFTGLLGETTYDTDLKRLVAHDGATAGGFPAAHLHVAQTFALDQTFAGNIAVGLQVGGDSLAIANAGSFASGNIFIDASGVMVGLVTFLNALDGSVTAANGNFTVSSTGATMINGALDMSTNLINNVVNPVAAQDAATKSYVDAASAAGAPPFTDTTPLVKGSADATKLMRFEVDGFTAATTRVLTPPNADITLAGINIAQTFAEDQTFGKRILLPNTTSATVGGIYFGGTRAITNFGTNNFFAGVSSGNVTLTGVTNTGAGFSALTSLTTGSSNSAVGDFALTTNTTGNSNSALGAGALFSNLGGSENTAVGSGASSVNISGDLNTAVGTSALEANEFSDASTAVGAYALYQATGPSNTALGYRAGDNITLGEFNIVIGFDVDAPSPTSLNTLNIGNLLFGTAIDGTGTTMSSGNIGIRTTAPESALDINSVTGNNLQLTYNDSDGAAANKVNFALSSTGDLTVTPSGGDVSLAATVLQITNGTDPGADPTAAYKQWSVGGEWQYRSSAASEGAGQTNRVHNRAAIVNGSGTNYTLTNSSARIDFGTTDPEIVLPTAGTYYIEGVVQFTADALAATDFHQANLRNSTDSVFIGASSAVSLGANFWGPVTVTAILTITASKTIQLWAFNATAARGTVQSDNTTIKYIRLY